MTINGRINHEIQNPILINKAELIDLTLNLRNGSHTYGSIFTCTEPKMTKGGNPFYGQVQKLSKWGFGINTEYYTKLINEMIRQGLDTATLTKEPSNYIRYNEKANCPVLRLKSDPSKLYLSLFPNKNSVSFVEYYINGRLANELETLQILSFTSGGNPSAKQADLGIPSEKEVKIRTVKLESIVAVTFEGLTYKVI